jgi:Holliday junction DNA helicase RuvA
MISYLQGKVIYSDGVELLLLLNSGVGYQVYYPKVLMKNEMVNIFTCQIFRENDQTLYGFETMKAKKFFELLLTVNGVGPKSAFSLIAGIGEDQITLAIQTGNHDILKKAQGIGKKAAEQIVISLKDKIDKTYVNPNILGDSFSKESPNLENNKTVQETILALESLGYKENMIMPVIQRNLKNKNISSEELIKLTLKDL